MEAPFVTVEHLVEGALRREPAAERLLYERHAPPIRRFVRGFMRDAHDAADVVQETFARAFRLLHTLDRPAEFAPWIHGIARNVCLENLKRNRRIRSLLLPANDTALTPEHELMGREVLACVERSLALLPPARRELLLLRVANGLTYDEIARRKGCSVAKAKVEVHRARRTIQGALRWVAHVVAVTGVAFLFGGHATAPRSTVAPYSIDPGALACIEPDALCRMPEMSWIEPASMCALDDAVTMSALSP
jgi:RNA polymerase sigma-70 factor (ECF subfamily)